MLRTMIGLPAISSSTFGTYSWRDRRARPAPQPESRRELSWEDCRQWSAIGVCRRRDGFKPSEGRTEIARSPWSSPAANHTEAPGERRSRNAALTDSNCPNTICVAMRNDPKRDNEAMRGELGHISEQPGGGNDDDRVRENRVGDGRVPKRPCDVDQPSGQPAKPPSGRPAAAARETTPCPFPR